MPGADPHMTPIVGWCGTGKVHDISDLPVHLETSSLTVHLALAPAAPGLAGNLVFAMAPHPLHLMVLHQWVMLVDCQYPLDPSPSNRYQLTTRIAREFDRLPVTPTTLTLKDVVRKSFPLASKMYRTTLRYNFDRYVQITTYKLATPTLLMTS